MAGTVAPADSAAAPSGVPDDAAYYWRGNPGKSRIMRRVIAGVKRTLELQCPGRSLGVFGDDVFIVSYPKSGNTWTRFLIANLVYADQDVNFASINRLIPDPEALSKRALRQLPRPRYIKSHQYFDPRYGKVIYIVRDPRDVALSQFHFHRKRKLLPDDSSIEQFVSRFVKGQTGPYGSWGDNVGSWMATRGSGPGFLLVRYEDLLADTGRELARIAVFLQVARSERHIEEAIRRSCAEEMRKMERAQAHLWSSIKDTRQDIPFVREAKAGRWKQELPKDSVAEIESAWAGLMRRFDYELANPSILQPRIIEGRSNGPAQQELDSHERRGQFPIGLAS